MAATDVRPAHNHSRSGRPSTSSAGCSRAFTSCEAPSPPGAAVAQWTQARAARPVPATASGRRSTSPPPLAQQPTAGWLKSPTAVGHVSRSTAGQGCRRGGRCSSAAVANCSTCLHERQRLASDQRTAARTATDRRLAQKPDRGRSRLAKHRGTGPLPCVAAHRQGRERPTDGGDRRHHTPPRSARQPTPATSATQPNSHVVTVAPAAPPVAGSPAPASPRPRVPASR